MEFIPWSNSTYPQCIVSCCQYHTQQILYHLTRNYLCQQPWVFTGNSLHYAETWISSKLEYLDKLSSLIGDSIHWLTSRLNSKNRTRAFIILGYKGFKARDLGLHSLCHLITSNQLTKHNDNSFAGDNYDTEVFIKWFMSASAFAVGILCGIFAYNKINYHPCRLAK